MTREEEAKKIFEEENNVSVEGEWNQIVYPSDSLDGANTVFIGNPKNQPTQKQVYEIGYILRFCTNVHEFTGKTSYDACEFIRKYWDEAKGMVGINLFII
jgi:hypothetical protein